jgi:hypothetical protein
MMARSQRKQEDLQRELGACIRVPFAHHQHERLFANALML